MLNHHSYLIKHLLALKQNEFSNLKKIKNYPHLNVIIYILLLSFI